MAPFRKKEAEVIVRGNEARIMHPAALEVDQLMLACQVRRERRSGPGGQHRNKVETAVVITHTPSGIKGEASERRSQAQNRKRAIQRLRVNLAISVREAPSGDGPSEIWMRHCRAEKIAVSRDHPHYPTLLAESLDVLYAESMDLRQAAAHLNCTSSQLVKLLQLDPKALKQVNDWRQQAGFTRLR